MTSNPPIALTIAGSDSGGAAGIQADLKAFAALGVFGTSAITAVTAQNTLGVQKTHVIPAEVVDAQITAVVNDLRPLAVKTGMLATAATVEAVAARARCGDLSNLVVDPVMVASTGGRLLQRDAEEAYLSLLFPHAQVATPNLREASVLVGRELRSVEDMISAAEELGDTGARYVVVKGGHLPGPSAVDVIWNGVDATVLSVPRVDTTNVHGTGCTLSAAMAANLALGHTPLDAIERAKDFLARALRGAAGWTLGAGQGPVDTLGWSDSKRKSSDGFGGAAAAQPARSRGARPSSEDTRSRASLERPG